MTVYLVDEVDSRSRNEILSTIEGFPSAEIKEFTSKDQALVEMRNALGPHAKLLDRLSKNPLPASIEVVFKLTDETATGLHDLEKRLRQLNGIDEIHSSDGMLRRFRGIIGLTATAGFVVTGVLVAGVLFIVTNTIRLTIYSRKEEIEILKLVGATDWFIKAPFLLEGLLHGVLGGGIALLTIFFGYLAIASERVRILDLVVLEFSFLPWRYALSVFLIGLFIGVLGSFISVGRFYEMR
jgi:cell division transport system permease protein